MTSFSIFDMIQSTLKEEAFPFKRDEKSSGQWIDGYFHMSFKRLKDVFNSGFKEVVRGKWNHELNRDEFFSR